MESELILEIFISFFLIILLNQTKSIKKNLSF